MKRASLILLATTVSVPLVLAGCVERPAKDATVASQLAPAPRAAEAWRAKYTYPDPGSIKAYG